MMRWLLASIAVASAACSKTPEPVAEAPAAPFANDLDVAEIMAHVMDPSARQFWAGWGEIYDKRGVTDISAKTDDEWKKVEDGATAVVIATNTLMLPAYRREPVADWNKYAKAVADLGMLGREGADKHDTAAMQDIGFRLDGACDACHKEFWKQTPP